MSPCFTWMFDHEPSVLVDQFYVVSVHEMEKHTA